MNPDYIEISRKPFDWLGNGMYFWEDNYDRALEWSINKKQRGLIIEPAVIGAVLSLGYCCNFLDKRYIQLLAYHFSNMKAQYEYLGKELPQNKDLKEDEFKDKKLRHLDCAAIEFMHARILDQIRINVADGGYSPYKVFDSTRGAFIEGGPAFDGAGIHEKTHIQICIRNPNCILGFFLPRKEIDFAPWHDQPTIAPAA